MKTLYVAWQSPTPTRAWYPIGRLDVEMGIPLYTFRYTQGAIRARREGDFRPLFAFPELEQRYESPELFPLFANRVLSPNRREFTDYIRWHGLDPAHSDPIEILAVSGGQRQTDSLEVFPKILPRPDGTFVCRFFVHGLRHVPETARERAERLEPREKLRVAIEINNPATRVALQLQTQDQHVLGWAPRYLVSDLIGAMSDDMDVSATVVRAVDQDAPLASRILVEFGGRLSSKAEPMCGPDFAPLALESVAT
jgi:hypothetical protein